TEDTSRYRGRKLPRGVTVQPRERILEAEEELRGVQGVTVLIHDQQCAAEARRLRRRGRQVEPPTKVLINERVCEGCGDCGAKSNCLSVRPVDTEFGPKTVIDQSSCNKDFSCLNGDCPSFITLEPARGRRARRRAERAAKKAAERSAASAGPARPDRLAADAAPEPALIVSGDDFRVRMPGIGGTGVVTVAQVLGTAALL